ncbi:signal peptidase II [Chloroflexota bacterium]
MQKPSDIRGGWQRNTIFFLIALLVVAADQISKIWIRANLGVGQSLLEVGFFRLTNVRNTGAAFGLFQGQSFPIAVVALVGVAILLAYALFVYRRFLFLDIMLSWSALGLVLGGTIGNLVDRLRFGYVTDFISIGIWPAFNLADSAVVIGAIMFAYSLLFLSKDGKSEDGRSI